MVKVMSLCTNCAQVMTNPICPSCFARHIGYWLRDKDLTKKEMNSILADLIKVIKEAEESPADVSCIVCGAKKVNLCTYCFTNKAELILEKNLRNKEIIEDFEEDFNTILWRI